jgi:DNA-binding transcriptional LysR family regulator
MLRCLYERESDIAVGFVAANHPRLKSAQVGVGELGLLYRRGEFMCSTPARLDVHKLRGLDYISLTGSGPNGTLLARELERLQVQLNQVVSVRTFFVAAALVRESVGIAVIDEFTARRMMAPELEYNQLSPPIGFGVHCMWLDTSGTRCNHQCQMHVRVRLH